MTAHPLGWTAIVRLGLVQTALGSIVVLTTSTMNRVMVVEWGLAAMLPGALVGLHYAVQLSRPRFGYGSDLTGRRTPWIIGGMGMLAVSGVTAALATAWMGSEPLWGIVLATVAFVFIGFGVGASGTSLLALLAKEVAEERRAAAAAIVWLMMIVGFVLTAGIAGAFLDPFSPTRLVVVTAVVASLAFVLTLVALLGIESGRAPAPVEEDADGPDFMAALSEIWREDDARRFAVFVFVSMLAYSMQDLILEPFAGIVFGLTPGQSTQLSGVQHGGVLIGMLLVGLCASGFGLGTLRTWAMLGCVASAGTLVVLVVAAISGPPWPLEASVFALGAANGAFAVAAIGSMMGLAGSGRARREGTRMGLWGAAQAIAFGLGGFLGTAGVDVARWISGSPVPAYALVFAAQALLFLVSAWLMASIRQSESAIGEQEGDIAAAGVRE